MTDLLGGAVTPIFSAVVAALAGESAARETAATTTTAAEISAPTGVHALLGVTQEAASLAAEHDGLRASAFGRLPKSLLLDCWTYLDLDAHIALTSAARWMQRLAHANARLVSPHTLSVQSADDDSGFERAIRRYHPRRLRCRPRGHNSFDWLAGYAPALTDLRLQSSEPVLSLAALEPLAQLTALDVECTGADLGSQLQYVCGLTRLERLRLCGAVDRWSALQRLENLTSLHLSSSASSDISVVTHLPRLATLAISACGADLSLRPLAACRALTDLRLEADGADLAPLGACSALTSLDFFMSVFAIDAAHIRPLVALRRLAFGAYGVDGLDALRDMRQLEFLAADGWQDVSLDSLRGCTALCRLSISYAAPLVDISALVCLTRLEHLRMRSNRLIRDITPLANLAQLVTADVGNSHSLVDISPLAGLTALTALRLDGCERVADLRPIAGLTRLRVLALPEGGWHPIDWSVLDRLTLLGEPVSELTQVGEPRWRHDVDAESFSESEVRQPRCSMPSVGLRRLPPTHHSHPHPLVLGRDHFGHSCNWCDERDDDRRSGAGYDGELDVTYRCDMCDYDLCRPCHEKLRVKSRPASPPPPLRDPPHRSCDPSSSPSPPPSELLETKVTVARASRSCERSGPTGPVASETETEEGREERAAGLRDSWRLVLAEVAGATWKLRRLARFVPVV